MTDRQLDILWTQSDFAIIPRTVPGRLRADDFIYFRWCSDIDPSRYTVLVESLDTAGPTFRAIGKLDESVELPFVKFGWHPRLGVVPDDDNLPSFESEMYRANTYLLRPTHGKNGIFQLERHGPTRPPGN